MILRTGLFQNPRLRMPFVALGILALLAGMWAGLIRLGWQFPPLFRNASDLHGPLMIAGFLGTVIGMERAVALGRAWAYVSPISFAVGALLLVSGAAVTFGALLMTLGSLILIAIYYVIVRRQPALFTYTLALGALALLIGNLIWLAGFLIPHVVWWWTGFLILTIVGERLELSRLLRLPGSAERWFVGAVALLLIGLLADTLESFGLAPGSRFIGERLAGAGMIALGLWLLRYDIARRTVRQRGLTRFIAAALLAGYGWLIVAGVLHITSAGESSGALYDAKLHTVFVGFVMSMIFGHAPIILPAVLARPIAFTPLAYAYLALLHLSLFLRVAGDLTAQLAVRQWGGMLNVLAVLLFLALTARGLLVRARST